MMASVAVTKKNLFRLAILSAWLLWSLAVYNGTQPIAKHVFDITDGFSPIGFSADERYLIGEANNNGDNDPYLLRFDLQTGKSVKLVPDHDPESGTTSVFSQNDSANLLFSPDGELFFHDTRSYPINRFDVWSFETNQRLYSVRQSSAELFPLGADFGLLKERPSEKGEPLQLYAGKSGKKIAVPKLPSGWDWVYANQETILAANKFFAATARVGKNYAVRVWKATDDQIESEVSFSGELLAMSEDGSRLCLKNDEVYEVRDCATGVIVGQWKDDATEEEEGMVYSANFSTDNSKVLIITDAEHHPGTRSHYVTYDVISGKRLQGPLPGDQLFEPLFSLPDARNKRAHVLGCEPLLPFRHVQEGVYVNVWEPDILKYCLGDSNSADCNLEATVNIGPAMWAFWIDELANRVAFFRPYRPRHVSTVVVSQTNPPLKLVALRVDANACLLSPKGQTLCTMNRDANTLSIWKLPITKPWLRITKYAFCPLAILAAFLRLRIIRRVRHTT